jgi:hypothetical protein
MQNLAYDNNYVKSDVSTNRYKNCIKSNYQRQLTLEKGQMIATFILRHEFCCVINNLLLVTVMIYQLLPRLITL